MRRTILLLLAGATLSAPTIGAARTNATAPHATRNVHDQLLRTPNIHSTMPAHPFVNLIVNFGQARNGADVDMSTFRAHLGRADITRLFTPIEQDGKTIGMRAAVEPPILRVGRRVSNHLRLIARSLPAAGKGARPRSVREAHRIRFKALDTPDHPPVAHLDASDDVVIPGAPIKFDASRSIDPESDVLSYHWDFGDGATDTNAAVTHTFAGKNVTASLTVSDGQLSSTSQATLIGCPEVDAGRTPGLLKVEAAQALEIASVPLGSSASHTFTVRNRDTTAMSQLKVELRACGFPYPTDPEDPNAGKCLAPPEFTLTPSQLDLGPGETADVTLSFTPASEGHRGVEITALASAANQCSVRLLGHGYGGSAVGTGPTLASRPVFYLEGGKSTPSGILPGGGRFSADATVGLCQTPAGSVTGDLCVATPDCPGNNICVAGGGELDPIDFCGDGTGGLYLITDDGTYTEPNPGPTERSVTIGHIDLDASGNRTGVEIFTRTTTQTSQIACDELAGGRVYAAEFHNFDSPQCFRDSFESLTAWHKTTGVPESLLDRIDGAEGAQLCNDDIDTANDLEVMRDGSAAFADVDGIFAYTGGLYRIWPSPLLMTPDITDPFQVHPDGSVLFANASNVGTRAVINLYKITQEQASQGAPRLSEIAPCATFDVANNGGRSFVFNSFAADRAAPGSSDAIVLVSFYTTAGGTSGPDAILSPSLTVQGTVAFASPAGDMPCAVQGLENLELLDQATF